MSWGWGPPLRGPSGFWVPRPQLCSLRANFPLGERAALVRAPTTLILVGGCPYPLIPPSGERTVKEEDSPGVDTE